MCVKLWSILILLCGVVNAESYCSLVVSVDRVGSSRELPITVQEVSGRKIEQSTVDGTASFCGLGLAAVTVTVGSPGCRQVVVRNVSLAWQETRQLRVVHDTSTCNRGEMPVAACSMLLRIVGVDQNGIQGARLVANAPFSRTHLGDDYGRIFERVAAGKSWVGTVSAPDHKREEINIPCVSENYSLERMIVLRPDR